MPKKHSTLALGKALVKTIREAAPDTPNIKKSQKYPFDSAAVSKLFTDPKFYTFFNSAKYIPPQKK
ncbi:hypothetical protein E3983_00865 [Legionella israelensis]|uniref:Uncharacterized protein n=1 Tax=Legionella israelensis TaxID=454 RepID=A0AAX1EDB4_9GAMM|nr:hypothetical protein [Legionella israelensis]QBR83029.1 hypothetical protein E3983_00865 [Legionella israelensis]